MFRKWRNVILIEGEKGAQIVARIEKLPDVNPKFDQYPVDYKIEKKFTKKKAIKNAIEFSKLGLYNMIYKE